MRRCSPLLCCASLGLLTATFAAAGAQAGRPDFQEADPAALVRQLGDPQFAARERATQQLIQIGGPALPALEAGGRDADREIRYRCRRILTIVRDQDLRRRLVEFAADTDGAKEYDLPGWTPYRKVVGDGRAARRLFVDMLREEPELFQAIQEGPQAAADTLRRRASQRGETASLLNREMPLGAIAALLFTAGEGQVNALESTELSLFSFCYQRSFQVAIATPPTEEVLIPIVGRWIRKSRGDRAAYHAMMLACQHQLEDGLIPATNVLRRPGASPQIRQFAVLTIAKLGGDSETPLLESLLHDRTVCAQQRVGDVRYATQIRDLALAALVHLSHRDLKEFGFSRFRPHPSYLIVPESVGFATDQERTKVFARWRAE